MDDIKVVASKVTDKGILEDITLRSIANRESRYDRWKIKEGLDLEHVEDLIKGFEDIGCITVEEKQQIISSYYARQIADFDGNKGWMVREGVSVDDIKAVEGFINDRSLLQNIVLSLINKSPEKVSLLVEACNANLIGINRYDIKEIVNIFSCCISVIDFPEFCQKLYPHNKSLQAEIFIYGLGRMGITDRKYFKSASLNFVTKLDNIEDVRDVLRSLKNQVTISPVESLNCLSANLKGNFESLNDILSSKNIRESLSENGMEEFRSIFRTDCESVLDNSLSNLFAYYLLEKDGVIKLKSMVKEDILQSLRDNFNFYDRSPLVQKKDLDQILSFLGDTYEQQSTMKSHVPTVGEISDKMRQLNIKSLTKEQILSKNYIFGESTFLEDTQIDSEEKKDSIPVLKRFDLSKEFQELFQNSTRDNVASFFERIFCLDEEHKLNDNDKRHLHDFFVRDKSILATVLQEKNGLDSFLSILGAGVLKDGCFANIGSHVKSAAMGVLIKDLEYKVLYNVFDSKLSYPILKKEGVDHPNESLGVNAVFHHHEVNNNYISFAGLIRSISEEFYEDSTRKTDKSDDFSQYMLQKFYGLTKEESEYLYRDMQTYIMDEYRTNDELKNGIENLVDRLEELSSNMAAYLLCRSVLPEMLENSQYLEKLNCFDTLPEDVQDYYSNEHPLIVLENRLRDIENDRVPESGVSILGVNPFVDDQRSDNVVINYNN